MITINILLLVLAFFLLCFAAVKTPEPQRYGWAGLAIWMLVAVLGVIK